MIYRRYVGGKLHGQLAAGLKVENLRRLAKAGGIRIHFYDQVFCISSSPSASCPLASKLSIIGKNKPGSSNIFCISQHMQTYVTS
jgi:hypothetical protein